MEYAHLNYYRWFGQRASTINVLGWASKRIEEAMQYYGIELTVLARDSRAICLVRTTPSVEYAISY